MVERTNHSTRTKEIKLSNNIEQRVKDVIAFQMGGDVSSLKPETKFIDDLGADSLDQIEIVMAMEDEFDLEIDDEKAEQVKTVQQAVDFITREITAA